MIIYIEYWICYTRDGKKHFFHIMDERKRNESKTLNYTFNKSKNIETFSKTNIYIDEIDNKFFLFLNIINTRIVKKIHIV